MKHHVRRILFCALPVASTFVAACRIEKLRGPDTATLGNEPGPGINACGITPASRVSEDGIGVLRIGTTLDAVRASCAVLSEKAAVADTPMTVRIDLGLDTAATEFVGGILRRITLHHHAYRTSDSLGVGTSIVRLMNLRSAVGVTDRNRLYAVSPAYCGLRFLVAQPAPRPPSAQNGLR